MPSLRTMRLLSPIASSSMLPFRVLAADADRVDVEVANND